MARKKKVVITYQELTPTTLAIKKDKKKVSIFGIFWLIVIFAIFIGGVIYLPEISQYVNDYLNPEITTPDTPSNDTPDDNPDDENPNEIKEYDISTNPEIVMENFKINNIKVENGKIIFDITNTGTDLLDFSQYKYFINLFDQNKKLLQRIMLHDEIIAANETINTSYNLVDSSVSVISLLIIDEKDYPSFVVPASESNTATFTCTKENEKIEYLLNNNKVYAISISYEVLTSDPNFSALEGSYKAMQATYNSVEGVTSNVDINNNTLYFRTIINLNTFKTNNVNIKNVYLKDTDAKVINFEMNAKGFTCN